MKGCVWFVPVHTPSFLSNKALKDIAREREFIFKAHWLRKERYQKDAQKHLLLLPYCIKKTSCQTPEHFEPLFNKLLNGNYGNLYRLGTSTV